MSTSGQICCVSCLYCVLACAVFVRRTCHLHQEKTQVFRVSYAALSGNQTLVENLLCLDCAAALIVFVRCCIINDACVMHSFVACKLTIRLKALLSATAAAAAVSDARNTASLITLDVPFLML